jgi:tetratricopeptide (TPR) repeat protein
MKPGTVVAGKYRIVEEIGQAKAGEKDLGDKDSLCLLGRLHPETLSVIARTAVMQYQKTKTLIDQIGRELNVGYVLGGSAQREGTRVWITAELIKVQDQTQLWSDSIEREMSGILALRNEVAQKVAGALTLKLLPAEQARLASARTVNPEAYEACLLGDSALKLTVADIESAMRYYELALEKEPNYAPAYIGISNVWACRQQMSLTPSSEAGPKAKAAAGREWEKSIELGPDDAAARATYSHYLMIVGRRDEAMRPIERAVELDPVEPHGTAFYAFVLP